MAKLRLTSRILTPRSKFFTKFHLQFFLLGLLHLRTPEATSPHLRCHLIPTWFGFPPPLLWLCYRFVFISLRHYVVGPPCSLGWPQTCHPPASTSQVLGLQSMSPPPSILGHTPAFYQSTQFLLS
jgi:hypothetical protein